MRDLLLQDVVVAARLLRSEPFEQMEPLCRQLYERADLADAYRIRFGVCHPWYGNGTLSAAAQNAIVKDGFSLKDDRFVRAMVLVLLEQMRRLQNT